MKVIKGLIMAVLALSLLVASNLFYAKTYQKVNVDGQELFLDQNGIPLDLSNTLRSLDGTFVESPAPASMVRKRFDVGDAYYTFEAPENVMKYYSNHIEAVKQRYKWKYDQDFLHKRYDDIYVHKIIPTPVLNLDDLKSSSFNENYDKGIVHTYTYYANIFGDIKPIITYVEVEDEESMLDLFEQVKELKGYDYLTFDDLFLLE